MRENTTEDAAMTNVAVLAGDTDTHDGRHQLLGTSWYLGAVLDRISSLVIYSDSGEPPRPDQSLEDEYGAEVLSAYTRILDIADWRKASLTRAGAQLRRLDIDHLVIGESRERAAAARLRPADGRNDVYADFLTERGAASKLAYLVHAIHHSDAPINLDETSRVLRRLRSNVAGAPAAVFGTGPSLDLVDWADHAETTNILCNSAVGNSAILEAADPVLIAAADPVFHSSFGTYATRFRRELASALDSTDAWFVCPTRDAPLYRHYLPPEAASRLLPVPLSSRVDFNLDLCATLEVKSTANVLTLLLLPLACTLSRSVSIAGCDGKPSSSDYFWTHSRQAQFDDELAATKQPFSGFFDIDYDAYYEEHLELLTAQIEHADRLSYSISNVTPSHIPILQRITHPSALHAGRPSRMSNAASIGPFERSQRVSVDALRAVYDASALTYPTGLVPDPDSPGLQRRTHIEIGSPDQDVAGPTISTLPHEDGHMVTTIGTPSPSGTPSTVVVTWHPANEPGETRFLHHAGPEEERPSSHAGLDLHRSDFTFPESESARRFLKAVAEQAARTVRPPS